MFGHAATSACSSASPSGEFGESVPSITAYTFT
jgi:hypothetical protein